VRRGRGVVAVVLLLVVVAMAGVAFAIAAVVAVALVGAARAPCCTACARLPADDVRAGCRVAKRAAHSTRGVKAEHNKQHGAIGAH
jgi:hypothetical protein